MAFYDGQFAIFKLQIRDSDDVEQYLKDIRDHNKSTDDTLAKLLPEHNHRIPFDLLVSTDDGETWKFVATQGIQVEFGDGSYPRVTVGLPLDVHFGKIKHAQITSLRSDVND